MFRVWCLFAHHEKHSQLAAPPHQLKNVAIWLKTASPAVHRWWWRQSDLIGPVGSVHGLLLRGTHRLARDLGKHPLKSTKAHQRQKRV